MTDIQIDSGILATLFARRQRLGRSLVFLNSEVGYSIYFDVGQILVYSKTTDGGATWAAPVQINAADAAGGVGVWFDRWTPGDDGVFIHIAYIQSNTNSLKYRCINTSTDALTAEVTVFPLADGSEWIDIVKARNGFLYIGGRGAASTNEFAKSEDNGASWDFLVASPMETGDLIILMPGNEADPADIWCIYWDIDNTSNQITLKVYDESGDSWSEFAISGVGDMDEGTDDYVQFAAMQRHSDNHVFLVAWTEQDAATADLLCWEIESSGSIVARTPVLENSDNSALAGMLINQQNGDIFVCYASGAAWLATVGIKYKKSTDGGLTWGDEVSFSDDADDDLRYLATTRCICTAGGRFIAQWQNEDLADLMTNKANSIAFPARFRTYPVISEFRTFPIPSEFRIYPVEV